MNRHSCELRSATRHGGRNLAIAMATHEYIVCKCCPVS
jgi:hypothetical protein